MNLDSITVVVQGPIFRPPGNLALGSTARCLASVRRFLPGAEVILSTWQGADCSGLAADQIIESEDPGPNFRMENGLLKPAANISRQMVSTRAGLAAATRPYAVKLRADAELRGTAFVEFQRRFPARAAELKLFRERVVAPTFISWNPDRLENRLFHISDLFFFGLTDDLRNLFSSPLPPGRCIPEEFAQDDPLRALAAFQATHTQEQFLHASFVHRQVGSARAELVQATAATRDLHDRYLGNNYVLAKLEALDVFHDKFHHYGSLATATHYTHGEWRGLYAHYCDPRARVGFDPESLQKRLLAPLVPLKEAFEKWRKNAPPQPRG